MSYAPGTNSQPFWIRINVSSIVGGGAVASFTVIQTDAGSNPVASGATDTLTFTSTELDITGDSTSDTVTWAVKNATVIGKVLTGFSASAGTVASTDTILVAINKMVANIALKAPLANPTFTGTVTTPVTASRALVTGASSELAAATTTATEIGYVNGVTSAIQTQMNLKAPSASPTFTGTVTTPVTASRALVTGASSELAVSATTATELSYVNGVTSAIQTQLGTKAPLDSPSFTTKATFGNYYLSPSEVDDGNSSTADTVDWSTGSVHKSTLTGNCTYTFSNPVTGGIYILKVIQGAGPYTVTWPATVKWPNSTAPTLSQTSGRMDLFTFQWDGTDYFGSFVQNYTP